MTGVIQKNCVAAIHAKFAMAGAGSKWLGGMVRCLPGASTALNAGVVVAIKRKGEMKYKIIDLLVVDKSGKHIDWDAVDDRIMQTINEQCPDTALSAKAVMAANIFTEVQKTVKRLGVKSTIKLLKGEL